jgi:hypothetical protein
MDGLHPFVAILLHLEISLQSSVTDIQMIQPTCDLGKTIILWGQDDVLIRAVEDLLGVETGWRLIRVLDDLNEVSLARTLAHFTPDVLIVHENAFGSDIRSLLGFVQAHSQLKIITIGLQNNQMEIFNKKRVCIREASDLLAAVRNAAAAET